MKISERLVPPGWPTDFRQDPVAISYLVPKWSAARPAKFLYLISLVVQFGNPITKPTKRTMKKLTQPLTNPKNNQTANPTANQPKEQSKS